MPFFENKGRRLFYRENGRGALLLVLPGNTATSACLDSELDYYSQRYHAVSLDFWGTGKSDRVDVWPDDWFQIAAADAAALAAQIDPQKAIWVGASGGGIVALLAAIHFPEQARAVIADSTPERFPPESFAVIAAGRSQRNPDQVQFWSTAQGEDWPQVIAADTDFLSRLSQLGGDLFQGRLNEISCPVLFTGNMQDEAIPNLSGQVCSMANQIPGSQVFLANRAGHPLMWSGPDLFRSTVDSFMELLAAWGS